MTVTEPCPKCGKKPENGRATHHLGCRTHPAGSPVWVTSTVDQGLDELSAAVTRVPCARAGCTTPRAVSKGPRPTKFCDEHKTTSKRSTKS